MSSSSSISTAAADDGDRGGANPVTVVHGDVIQSHILTRLDGPTLASTACSSAQLFSLCKDDHLWRRICNATWPSTADRRVGDAISAFPSGHRSFYSDAFPALRHHHQSTIKTHQSDHIPETSELIFAVDIFSDGELIYSKVLAAETTSGWFLNTPFRVDLLDPKETVETPFPPGACLSRTAEERLKLSWILIDPLRKRAVNIASSKAVDARRHWLTEDIQLRYATVVAGGGEVVQFAVVVTCGRKEGGEVRVRDVSMQVEDMDGKILSGLESLVILEEAMDGKRSKKDSKMEREVYEKFLRMKERRRERRQRREKGLDMVCIAAGVSIFCAVWIFFLWGSRF